MPNPAFLRSEPGYRTVGNRPRPRVLVAWADESDDPSGQLERLGLDVRSIDRLSHVYQPDFDVLVVDDFQKLVSSDGRSAGFPRPDEILFVVTFARGASATGVVDQWIASAGLVQVHANGGDLSERISVQTDLPEPVRALVEDRLVPLLSNFPRQHQWFSGPEGIAFFRPFVLSSAGHVLAGTYKRGQEREGWVLPQCTPDKPAWIIAALQVWAGRGGWPPPGEWQRRPHWQTAEESKVIRTLTDLRQERRDADRRFDAEEGELMARLEEAERQAAVGDRRLLEAKGEPLVEAVAEAFRGLGYTVEIVDETAQEGDRREDLRLGDPDRPGQAVIVEVKGYDAGVRAVHIANVERHATRARQAGLPVRAAWWVVNHTRRSAPEDRPTPLVNDEDVLKEHSQEYGLLLIETQDLSRSSRQSAGASSTLGRSAMS